MCSVESLTNGSKKNQGYTFGYLSALLQFNMGFFQCDLTGYRRIRLNHNLRHHFDNEYRVSSIGGLELRSL